MNTSQSKVENLSENLERNIQMIMALEDNFEALYDVSLETNAYTAFVKGDFYYNAVDQKIINSDDFFGVLKENIARIIYKDDREGIEDILDKEKLCRRLSENERIEHFYRVYGIGDEVNWFKMRIVYKNTERKNIIVGIFNASEELRAKQIENQLETITELSAFTQFFLDTYVSAYYVNLDDLSCKVFKRTAKLEADYPIVTNYFDSLRDYISHDVHPDDRQELINDLDPGRMREILQDKNEYTHLYRDISNGVTKVYRLQVLRGGDSSHAAFGFLDITEELHKDQEQRDSLKNALFNAKKEAQRKDFLIEISNAVKWSLLVNENDEILSVTYSDEFRRQVSDELPDNDGYAWSKLLYPDDREEAMAAFKAVIADHSCSTPYDVVYRMTDRIGADRWYRSAGRIVREENGMREFFGVNIDIDDTVEGQQKRLLGAVPLSADILTKANIGLWAFELDEGKAPRMYVDEAMLGLVGLDHQVPPEETYHAWYDHIDEGSYGLVADAVVKMTDGEHAEVQYPWHHPDGRTMIVRCGGVRNYEYTKGIRIEGTHQNVTEVLHFDEEHFKMEFELADRQRRLKAFGDMINAAQWSMEIKGEDEIVSVDWSDDFRNMLGYENVEDFPNVIGSWSSRLHEEDRERSLENFNHSIRNKTETLVYDIKYRLQKKTGEYVWYHALGRMKNKGNGNREMFGILIDITSDKLLEEALTLAQSASRAKTTFLNNMSHDIRTPMNAIIGYTGLAASHIDNKELVRDYLYKIGQSSDHLLSLINDVLDMSRIESGKMNLNENPENLSDIIHTIRDIVQHDIHSKQIDFYVDAVDVNDESIVCDKLRLNQILLNVLSNAIKYTPNGGTVTMRVTEKSVRENGYASYEFNFKDNGMGMSPEFLKTIYDPFTRVKSTTMSGIQGTGLGMAITKNIVDMMGGTIDIKSTPGKGTEVSISLEFKMQNRPKAPLSIPTLNGMRGLVVDDNSSTCLSIAKMLRDIGLRSEWCTSGKEAVIRAGEGFKMGDQFKVYIIDWLMPDMNGIETARRIRKVIGNSLPIIILTAYDWSDIEEEAHEAGVTAFISKPLFPSDLHNVLAKLFETDKKDKPAESDNTDISGKRILVVEDNELNLEIATAVLQEYGCLIDTACDGDIAVQKVKEAAPGDYDLIIMDIQMPTMDGYEATRQIRALGTELSNIPIIAMTANAFEEDRKLAMEAGMNEHISKPFSIDNLKKVMGKFLKK